MEENTPVSTAEIENFLKRRLGDPESAELMLYINNEIENQVKARTEAVQQEIDLWRTELKNEFATKEDAVELKTKLVKRVSAVEGTIILWGFAFWITLILAFYIMYKFMV